MVMAPSRDDDPAGLWVIDGPTSAEFVSGAAEMLSRKGGIETEGRIVGIFGDPKGILNTYGDEQISVVAKRR